MRSAKGRGSCARSYRHSSRGSSGRRAGTASVLAARLHVGPGQRRRPPRRQRLLDPCHLPCPGLGQAPRLLALLARKRRLQCSACAGRYVHQAGDRVAQPQLRPKPNRAPALCVAPGLPHVGGLDDLGLRRTARIQAHPEAGHRVRDDVGHGAAVPPQLAAFTALHPAGGRGDCWQIVMIEGGLHGRKDTSGRRRE